MCSAFLAEIIVYFITCGRIEIFGGYISVDWVRKAKITRKRNQHGCTKKVSFPQKALTELRRWFIATFRPRRFDSEYPPCNLNHSYEGKAFVIRRCHRHCLKCSPYLKSASFLIETAFLLTGGDVQPAHFSMCRAIQCRRQDYTHLHPT